MCLLTLPAVVKTMLHSPHWNIRWPSWLQNHIIDIHLLETAVNCSRNIFWIGVKWGILWGNYCHMTRRPVWFRFSIKLRKNIARVQNYPDIAIWNSLCPNSKMADTHSLSDWLSKGRYRTARAATNNPKTIIWWKTDLRRWLLRLPLDMNCLLHL